MFGAYIMFGDCSVCSVLVLYLLLDKSGDDTKNPKSPYESSNNIQGS